MVVTFLKDNCTRIISIIELLFGIEAPLLALLLVKQVKLYCINVEPHKWFIIMF